MAHRLLATALILVGVPHLASASPLLFTDRDAFLAALGGTYQSVTGTERACTSPMERDAIGFTDFTFSCSYDGLMRMSGDISGYPGDGTGGVFRIDPNTAISLLPNTIAFGFDLTPVPFFTGSFAQAYAFGETYVLSAPQFFGWILDTPLDPSPHYDYSAIGETWYAFPFTLAQYPNHTARISNIVVGLPEPSTWMCLLMGVVFAWRALKWQQQRPVYP